MVSIQYGTSKELDFIQFEVDYQDRVTLMTFSRPFETQTLVYALQLMRDHKNDQSVYCVGDVYSTLTLSAYDSGSRRWTPLKPSPEFPLVDQAEKRETELPS